MIADGGIPPVTFVDTNILVYAHDTDAGHKYRVAVRLIGDLWDRGRPVISTQVLQEFVVTVTRKLKHPLDTHSAIDLISAYTGWPVQAVLPETIIAAAELGERELLSFWDALILTAARIAGAALVYSEDMQHGRDIDGVRIVNPFV